MNDVVIKLIVIAVVIFLTAWLTRVLTDKKGWHITVLIVLLACATFAEKAVQFLFEEHRPRLIVENTPLTVEHEDTSLKLTTDIWLKNAGDRTAEKVVPVTTAYLEGKSIGTYTNQHEMQIDVEETIHIPMVITVKKDVWEGKAELTLTMLVPYFDGDEAMAPLKKKWVFDSNKGGDLMPMWEVMTPD